METLPTSKEADFNDFLAGFERFGFCEKEAAPDDLENLKHYCKALAFEVSGDLTDMRNRLNRDLAVSAEDNFSEVESLAYSLKNIANSNELIQCVQADLAGKPRPPHGKESEKVLP